MRIGCIYTLKNEEELITFNMRYHRYLGVTDFFAFLDHSTDMTKSLLESMPDVDVFENPEYSQLLRYSLDKAELNYEIIESKYQQHNGVRQILHANMALELCRKRGIDFLIQIDPDELICIDQNKVEADSLKNYLGGLPDSVGAVIFENLESVPTEAYPADPFTDTLFKKILPDSDAFHDLPKLSVADPYTGENVPAGWYWGHTSGKLAVRVTPEAYFSHFVHSFHTAGRIIKEKYLLHYNILSLRQFICKYRNFNGFPQYTSFGHKVRPLRTLFVRLANDPQMTEMDLLEYYDNNIRYTEQDIIIIKSKSNYSVGKKTMVKT